MALDFGDKETEKLAAEVAKLANESEEEAVRRSLRERRDRLELRPGGGRRRPEGGLHHFMETKIWPLIPVEHRGGPPMTKAERAELLGYGPDDD